MPNLKPTVNPEIETKPDYNFILENDYAEQHKICRWKYHDEGMHGFKDFIYDTNCGHKSIDPNKVKGFVYCPYCGGKIERT